VLSVNYNCVCVQITFTPKNANSCTRIELKCFPQVNLLNTTGHVMHQQFNIQQLYVLPTLYLCVLCLSDGITKLDKEKNQFIRKKREKRTL